MDKTAIPNNGKICGFHSEVLHVPNLVARKKELEVLEHHLESAAEGMGTTVFVSGEAGAGKTRLVNEFLNRVQIKEIRVLKGWCLSNAAVPYFPFFEAFSVYFSSDQNRDAINLKNWLEGPHKEISPKKTQIFTPQAWKDQTFLAVTKTLSGLSAKNPILLFIDDIHWADSASLALIHYISRVIKSKRILLVATFRSEELKVNSEGRSNSLVETLRLMRREDLFTEIKITSLSHENISELARNMLGGELQQELTQKLTKESQGNPLFVVESLKMMRERNALIQENNQWKLTSTQLEIPSKIKDIILQRLECLDRNQRKIVEVASVIGEEFDPELLALALDSDLDEIITALEVISQTTTLVDCKDESYWFEHARTRDSIYEEISPALKRLYHKKIAPALIKKSEKSNLPFSELAYHYNKTGDKENAIKYSLAAGQDALAKWSNTEAIEQFSRILNITREDTKHIAEFALALEGLGDAYYANSMVKDAAKIFLELYNKTTNDVVRLRALRKAMESVFQYGDMPYLLELAETAEPLSSVDRLEYARILMSKARSYHMRAIYSHSNALRKALQIFDEEYSLWDIAWVLVGAGPQRAFFAETDFEEKQGLAESLRAIALFEELGDLRWQMEAYYVAGMVFSYCLLENEALTLLARGVEIDEENKFGDYLRIVYNLATSARTLMYMGNLQESLAYNHKALKFLEKTDSGVAHGMVYSNLTIIYALLKNFTNSEKYFNKLMKLTPEVLTHILIQIDLAKAVFLAAKTKGKKSEQLFKKRFELFENQKMPTASGFILRIEQLYAWVLKNQGRTKEANILLEETKKTIRQVEEKYAHASLQAQLMVRREIEVGKEIEMRLDMVNVGKQSSHILRIEDLVSSEDFKVTTLPEQFDFSKNSLEIDKKEIGAFQVDTIKLEVQAIKPGIFCISPLLVYMDDLGETRKCKVNQVTLTVHKAQPQFEVLPGRITTGYTELDRLLMGGIPENYSVVLTGSPSDERAHLTNNFLEAGTENDEVVFYVTTEADNLEDLLKNPNFHLFLCNPKPKTKVPDLPNVTKLRSITDLTNLNISLAKAYRNIDPSKKKRICIETISNVLLNYEAKATCKWITELTTDLSSKGFTMLAVMDTNMHPPHQANAVTNSFDGEISLSQSEDPTECKKTLRIKRLKNQKYLKNSTCMTT